MTSAVRTVKGIARLESVLRVYKQEGRGEEECRILPPGSSPSVTDLQIIELGFELLDRAMSHLQVLIETVSLSDELKGGLAKALCCVV